MICYCFHLSNLCLKPGQKYTNKHTRFCFLYSVNNASVASQLLIWNPSFIHTGITRLNLYFWCSINVLLGARFFSSLVTFQEQDCFIMVFLEMVRETCWPCSHWARTIWLGCFCSKRIFSPLESLLSNQIFYSARKKHNKSLRKNNLQ